MKNKLLNAIFLPTLLVAVAPCLGAMEQPSKQEAHEHEHTVKKTHDDHGDEHTDQHEQQHQSHGEEAEGAHSGEGHGEQAHGEGVSLNDQQMSLASIKVMPLTARSMDYQVYAPGEIKANGYTSYLVSPRVESVVTKRHATLGEHVKAGQPLVTLFSETMAETQAAFLTNQAEWQRVKTLGRKTVGDKRYVNSQTAYEASAGKLRAFGMDDSAVKALSANKHNQLGEYTLTAAIDGAVLSDDFHQGQRVEVGEALMKLANEHELWIEAQLAANSHLILPKGSIAQINVGDDVFEARVAQEAHTIDPVTRTRVVRLLVNNDSHRLHPGMFAEVYFQFKTETPILAVPEAALMRGSDGDWTVFSEDHPGEFKAVEVELGRSFGKWREISGVQAGSRIVMKGAFFVASQIAKGEFDPHNH